MPLYEYRCPDCRETREVLVRSAETASVPECPSCGRTMEKQWSTVANLPRGTAGSGCGAPRGGFS